MLLVGALLAIVGALWLRGNVATPALVAGPVATVSSVTRVPADGPRADQEQLPPLVATGVFIEPGDGRGPLLDEIADARKSIVLEVYLITDDEFVRALAGARRRAVDVRVILEEHPFGGDGRQEETFARLQQAGIAVRWGNPVFRFTHMKRTRNHETSY